MKIKFNTMKFIRLRDYFNVGWYADEESDFTLNIIIFGREYSWDFYKKDSEWMDYYNEDLDQA